MTNVIAWRYLPKIGDNGMMISRNHVVEDWRLSKQVASYMRKYRLTSAWFQIHNGKTWDYGHGLIRLQNGKAVISQWG